MYTCSANSIAFNVKEGTTKRMIHKWIFLRLEIPKRLQKSKATSFIYDVMVWRIETFITLATYRFAINLAQIADSVRVPQVTF